MPPRFSAIKIQGERAYDLARDGEVVELQARDGRDRPPHPRRTTTATARVLEADCGKGTYVRAIARDLGRALGCLGHVAALRRTRVGPFSEDDAVMVDDVADRRRPLCAPSRRLSSEIPPSRSAATWPPASCAASPIILRGRDAPLSGKIYATCNGVLVAVGDVERGEFVPHRVFNLGA